eukprot:m.139685 g.139685  ORF g.139685 m.139685 type:complete len:568 (-) comp23774_c0_seq1:280-1983(-)
MSLNSCMLLIVVFGVAIIDIITTSGTPVMMTRSKNNLMLPNVNHRSNHSSTPCTNMLGLAAIFNGGVDLTNVELNTLSASSVRANVFDYTCDEGQTYGEFSVPDQIIGLRPIPSTTCSLGVWSSGGYGSMVGSLTANFDAKFFGLMSGSTSMSEALGVSMGLDGIVGSASCSVSAFEVILAPAWELSPSHQLQQYFTHYLKPDNASTCVSFNASTVDSYDEIIHIFGTGILVNGTVGGMAQFFFGFENNYEHFMNADDINANAKASLFNVISAAGGASGHMDVNVNFTKSIVFGKSITIGGTSSPFGTSSASWQAWEESVITATPALVQMATTNLSSIVSNWDGYCGSQLALAEKNYYVRAFVQNVLLKALTSMQEFYSKHPPSSYPICQWKLPNCTAVEEPATLNETVNTLQSMMKNSPVTPLASAVVYSGVVSLLASQLPMPSMTIAQSVSVSCPDPPQCQTSYSTPDYLFIEIVQTSNSFAISTQGAASLAFQQCLQVNTPSGAVVVALSLQITTVSYIGSVKASVTAVSSYPGLDIHAIATPVACPAPSCIQKDCSWSICPCP